MKKPEITNVGRMFTFYCGIIKENKKAMVAAITFSIAYFIVIYILQYMCVNYKLIENFDGLPLFKNKEDFFI
jgi:RsiW-degrading membrane proteinase PrsW (M82 family)